MADHNDNRGSKSCAPGLIEKASHLEPQEITDAELRAINKYTLEPLTADQVFTFKAVLCDNEVDRTYERFTMKALQTLQKLFVGKTVLKDHYRSADKQVARIYSTELVPSTKMTAAGEPYTQLVAHCYMVKTASNADLIAEIKGGIKKEGSVGCRVGKSICSICGTDNRKTYCPHYPGRSYEKDGGPQVCTFTLDDVKDAHEFSLVAVPAQKAAGVSKSYTGETVYEPAESDEKAESGEPSEDTTDSEKAAGLALRARLAAIRANHTN